MSITLEKSSFLYNEVDEGLRNDISALLPFKMESMDEGFKYLGYRLKPLGYGTKDWRWLIKSFEKRIILWSSRFLSLGGMSILLQSILTGILVY